MRSADVIWLPRAASTGNQTPGQPLQRVRRLHAHSTGLRAAATFVYAAHWPAVSTALFEEHVDELTLPGDKTDDGENESPTAAMEVNNEDNESVQSKTAAPAPAEHEAQLQKDKRKAEALLAKLATKALPAPPVETTTELVPAEAFDEVAATRAAKKLTVAKLRKALEATGASTAGLKPVLVARFVEVEWAAAVFEHATAMAAARSQTEPVDAELTPPAPPAEALVPQTPARRDTMLSSVTRRSLADETLLQSFSPLERIQNASRQVQGDKLDQSQSISALEKNLAALTTKLDKAKDMNAQLRAWGRRCKEITKDSHSKTIDAEARLRRLIVGMNNAQMVSKERVRIRALEKNLGKVTRMYSMEKESHKETIESHKETIDRVEEIWAMKFEDNRIPYRVLIHFSGIVKSHTEENRNFLEDKIILNKELLEDKIILNKEDWMRAVDKDIEVNVERTKNAMRKDVQEKTAIIIERDERIDMLEKHLDKTCVERDCALATIAERDERIASLEKQLATTRALLYVPGPRNQQGPSPPSA